MTQAAHNLEVGDKIFFAANSIGNSDFFFEPQTITRVHSPELCWAKNYVCINGNNETWYSLSHFDLTRTISAKAQGGAA